MTLRHKTRSHGWLLAAVSFWIVPAMYATPGSFCDVQGRGKAVPGMTTSTDASSLTVTWDGAGSEQLRARFTIVSGAPTLAELSTRRAGGLGSS
jgi:hypothetical protein